MLTAKTPEPFSDLNKLDFRQIFTSTGSQSSGIEYQLNQILGPNHPTFSNNLMNSQKMSKTKKFGGDTQF